VQARRTAGLGVGLSTDLDRYRATYKAAWDFVLEEIGHSKVSERHKRIVLREASAVTTSLLARLLAEVTEVHFGELKRFSQTSTQRRARLVRRILAGERVDQRELDYDFNAEHLAVVGTGTDVEKVLETLSRRLGRQLLLMPQDDGTVSAWLRGSSFSLADFKRELNDVAYANVTLAIGRPASRVAGFRRTYRLAQAAFLVAQYWPQRITWYDDVAREAHALKDDDYATSLIETYIAPLDKGRQGANLRQTLKAFYATGYNEAKAAKLLKIHRHTVERHLDRTKELIGRELHTCHGEIELALRLVELQDVGEGDG
jgi:sugar diacid utilization regulator